MNAAAETGRNAASNTRFNRRVENEQADAGRGRPKMSRETKLLSGAN